MVYSKLFGINMKILLEGIDGVGKSSLAKELAEVFNIPCIKHLGKPKSIKRYKGCKIKYQLEVFKRFNKVLLSNVDVVYDRAHLGEFVYGPLYRGKPCCTLSEIEDGTRTKDIVLILLVTDNFDMLRDDGENFDSNNQEREQEMFKNAFHQSRVKNKILIYINEGEDFRNRDDIVKEVLMKIKSDGSKAYVQPHSRWKTEQDYYGTLDAKARDWILNFDSMENDNPSRNNPLSELYTDEMFEDTKESFQSTRKCIMSRGAYFLCEEQGEFENLESVEESNEYDRISQARN